MTRNSFKNLLSREGDRVQAVGQRLSYQFSGEHLWCTYAYPEICQINVIEMMNLFHFHIHQSAYLSMAPPSSACSISNCDSKLTNHSNERWSRLIQKKSTLRRFIILCGISLDHSKLHRGQVCRAFQYRCIIDCKIEANGVTPIPVAIRTACWARNMWLDGAPYGPSI